MNYPQQSYNPYQTGAMPPYMNRFPQFPPNAFQPQRPAANPLSIEVYPVTNPDEAKAQIVNPMQPTIFCNFGQNEIYVKHIDNNGQGQFHVFRLVVDVTPTQEVESPWVPIHQRLDNIEQLLGSIQHVSEPVPDPKPAALTHSTASKPNVPAAPSASAKGTGDVVGKK